MTRVALPDANEPATGDRCVVVDNGERVAITIYSADQRAAVAVMSPALAIYIAGRLIAAALPKLREAVDDRGW
jgi:hypothetical protein